MCLVLSRTQHTAVVVASTCHGVPAEGYLKTRGLPIVDYPASHNYAVLLCRREGRPTGTNAGLTLVRSKEPTATAYHTRTDSSAL